MKILCIGDIVGKAGRQAVRQLLPKIKREKGIDFTLANGENAAGRKGITPKITEELFSYGIDVITMGDHVWSNKEIFGIIDTEERILRPANYPPGTTGRGAVVLSVSQQDYIGILNLVGRVFLLDLDCPFRVAKDRISKLRQKTSIIIVDFHAEATSEKVALGWYLDGKVSAVIGTHTHVQTADEKILSQGTAYITDVGMTGAQDSVIGIRKDLAIRRLITQLPTQFEVAEDDAQLCGVILNIDSSSGRAQSIERVKAKLE